MKTPEKYIATLFLVYGVQAFSMLRGQFSLVIWDSEEQTLYGARDSFGIFPLYYTEDHTRFCVATESKLLLNVEQVPEANKKALQHFFSFQYVPDPFTMTEKIHALQAGHYFEKKLDEPVDVQQYFHAEFKANGEMGEKEVVTQIQDALTSAVSSRLPKHTSAGVFLSGGIDSSLIAAMAKNEHSSIQAFSVGFAEEGYSEIEYAKKTADALEIDLKTHTITASEFKDVVTSVVAEMDAPIADPSCIPLYIAAREAKKHVDIVLSGEGADELFGGYTIYREHESIKYVAQLPELLRRSIRFLATIIPEGIKGKNYLLRASTPLEQRYIGNAKIFEECMKRNFLYVYDQENTYEHQTMPLYGNVQYAHPTEQMQYIDLHTWLPGNILAKARTMTKANGLTVRMPFLDEDVFSIAKRIPVNLKIRNHTTKYILREAAKGIAPRHVIEQKKLGFPVPLRKWLKKELYDWAINIIKQSETGDLIDHSYALGLIHKHATGRIDYSRKIWTILIFMMWYTKQVEQTDIQIDLPYAK